jgi:triacylglycerol esterase/lipase EstA (alpha/beta hydrolase family)
LGKSPNAYTNTLSGKKGGLDAYVDKVLAALNAYIVKKRFGSADAQLKNIILSAHSAGGRQMRMIASNNNPVYGSAISECWGFDSLYEGVASWIDWATTNKNKKLFIYYKSSTEGNAGLLSSRSKNLPNVFLKKSAAKNHYFVPKEHLKERVKNIGRADLSKSDFEWSGMPDRENVLF